MYSPRFGLAVAVGAVSALAQPTPPAAPKSAEARAAKARFDDALTKARREYDEAALAAKKQLLEDLDKSLKAAPAFKTLLIWPYAVAPAIAGSGAAMSYVAPEPALEGIWPEQAVSGAISRPAATRGAAIRVSAVDRASAAARVRCLMQASYEPGLERRGVLAEC